MSEQCPRCAMYGLDGQALAENIAEYLAVIPEEIKADVPLYKERLALCSGCDELNLGMCGECGCYVEVRAVKKNLGCPVGKW